VLLTLATSPAHPEIVAKETNKVSNRTSLHKAESKSERDGDPATGFCGCEGCFPLRGHTTPVIFVFIISPGPKQEGWMALLSLTPTPFESCYGKARRRIGVLLLERRSVLVQVRCVALS
jgi:hypothetical protein